MPSFRKSTAAAATCTVLALCLSQSAWSEDDATPFKLTVGDYYLSGGDLSAAHSLDVNLRYTYADGHFWVGWYRAPSLDVSQLRGGWDATYALGPVRILPSLQAASGGFVGSSLAVETGDSWFVGTGLGRTNLRPYANLNFDPNDSYTVYGGYKWADDTALSLAMVRDNRQNPDQQHVHLVYRVPTHDGQRLTIDLLAKQGTVDGRYIRRTGLSLTYDWPRYFVRAAYDPKVNFTAQNMFRVSVGSRF